MTFDKYVGDIQESLDAIRDEFAREHTITGAAWYPVTVDGAHVGNAEVEVEFERPLDEIADDSIPDALDVIEERLSDLVRLCKPLVEGVAAFRQLAGLVVSTESPEANGEVTQAPAATSADTRRPWAANSGAIRAAAEYHKHYQPPKGYDWTGEFRAPVAGDFWVNSNGDIRSEPYGSPRVILRKLQPGEQPSYGLLPTPSPAPSTPASPQFEPPKTPTNV